MERDEILRLAPEFLGTVRYNHDDCPAGRDTKRRLYITRKHDDHRLILWHCFNCGEGGAIHNVKDEGDGFGLPLRAVHPTDKRDYAYPETISINDPAVPPSAATYLYSLKNCGLTHREAETLPVQFDPMTQRVVFPVYDKIYRVPDAKTGAGLEGGFLNGYISRRLLDCDASAKYLMYMDGNQPAETVLYNDNESMLRIHATVIVEDLVSAIHLNRFVTRVVPLYRTTVPGERVLEMVKWAQPIIVWLDNDNPIVHSHALKIHQLVAALGGTVYTIRDRPEAKKFSVGDNLNLLNSISGVNYA